MRTDHFALPLLRRIQQHTVIAALAVVFSIGLFESSGLSASRILALEQTPRAAPLTASALSQSIGERLMRVEEFRALREEAAKRGVRVWLFGGTAAGFAHYVKWDVLREEGDSRYQADRFDYDYTNIYRSTQDLDIVVDGGVAEVQAFQSFLQQKFSYFQGSKGSSSGKSAWEVRSLRENMGPKQALLDNPDFSNQHTDSNSTGMIEVSLPPPESHDPVVRDLRDWGGGDNHFLEDVRLGKLHYYYSEEHEGTSRYEKGLNPPLLSVIRYLTKAFQYELQIEAEDLARVQKVIDGFDPATFWEKGERPMDAGYVRGWLQNNGPKMIQHAVNIEYAWNTLEKLGLRRKLIALDGARLSSQGSLAWWLNKEPLRSHKVGQTPQVVSGGVADFSDMATMEPGLTAAELAKRMGVEILIVAHETNSFLAYESITRAHTGEPNVLISRRNTAGEAAGHGDGFYTRIGKKGARGTGLTIRFTVDPLAREGIDFIRNGDHLVFRNKSALRVIPETLNIGVVEYFKMLTQGEALSPDDKGIVEKLKRRIGHKVLNLSRNDFRRLKAVIGQYWKSGRKVDADVLGEWAVLELRYRVSSGEIKTAFDYVSAVAKFINVATNRHDLSHDAWSKALSRAVTETFDLFMGLNPCQREINGLDSMAGEARVRVRYVNERIKSASTPSQFFEALHSLRTGALEAQLIASLLGSPGGAAAHPAEDKIQASELNQILDETRDKFFALSPTFEDVYAIFALESLDKQVRHLYAKDYLKVHRSLGDLVRLVKGSGKYPEDLCQRVGGEFIGNNIALFLAHAPPFELVIEYMKIVPLEEMTWYMKAAANKVGDLGQFMRLVQVGMARGPTSLEVFLGDQDVEAKFFHLKPALKDVLALPAEAMKATTNDRILSRYVKNAKWLPRSPQDFLGLIRWASSGTTVENSAVAKEFAGSLDLIFKGAPSAEQKRELLNYFVPRSYGDLYLNRLLPTIQTAEEYRAIVGEYVVKHTPTIWRREADPFFQSRDHLLKLGLSSDEAVRLLRGWDWDAPKQVEAAGIYVRSLDSPDDIAEFFLAYQESFTKSNEETLAMLAFKQNKDWILSRGFGFTHLEKLRDNLFYASRLRQPKFMASLLLRTVKPYMGAGDYVKAAEFFGSLDSLAREHYEEQEAGPLLEFFKQFMNTRPRSKQIMEFLGSLRFRLDSLSMKAVFPDIYFYAHEIRLESGEIEDYVQLLKTFPLTREQRRTTVRRILGRHNDARTRKALRSLIEGDIESEVRILGAAVDGVCMELIRKLGGR